jgi:undecaprenyl-diphosphatase
MRTHGGIPEGSACCTSHMRCEDAMLSSVTIIHAILIGALQGLTEFLPVSSSGHLVLAGIILNIPLDGSDALGFDILLHGSSLLAILLVYRRTWGQLIADAVRGKREPRIVFGWLLLGTVPGVLAGLLLQDTVGEARSLKVVGMGFLLTAIVLIAGERLGARRASPAHDRLTTGRVLLIGIAQALAILPGVSRSGLTISTGRALGMGRPAALDFSFLLAVPIIAGATAKTLLDAWTATIRFPPLSVSIAGCLTSFVMSVAALLLLRRLVIRRSLGIFAWYLLPLSALLLMYASLR